MKILDDIPVFGDSIDEGALHQIRNCKAQADHVLLCADHHKGYNMPIGGVAAYKNHISPAGVGFDIACGNKAVRLDATFEDIRADLPKLADRIFGALSFGVGRGNAEPVDHPLFEKPIWRELPMFRADRGIQHKAKNQLGTIGSGNHYVDVFKDEDNCIWVGVHFGSRGLGHRIASEYIRAAGANPNGDMNDPPVLLEVASDLGDQYLAGMQLAGEYAYAGRDWVCQKVAELIGAPIVEEVHNHHNFAWRETHFGEQFWVVRKGATPAAPGQKGFVGGSIGDQSVILEGVDSDVSLKALYSTVHGAGRVMSRTKAAGKRRFVKGVWHRVSDGIVNMEKVRQEVAEKGIQLRGAGADEAPEVYKRLPEVLEQHSPTIKVLHRLRPVIVCMAGEGEFDPYKD